MIVNLLKNNIGYFAEQMWISDNGITVRMRGEKTKKSYCIRLKLEDIESIQTNQGTLKALEHEKLK